MTILVRRARSACLSMLGWAMLAISPAMPAWAEPDTPTLVAETTGDFWTGDFAALERRNAVLRDGGAMTAEGRPELMMFREGIRNVVVHKAKPH